MEMLSGCTERFLLFLLQVFFLSSYAVLKDWWSFSSSGAAFECDFECLSTSSGSSQLRSVRYPPPSFALLRLCVSSSRWDACPQSCDELNKVEAVCRSFCGGCWCFKMRVKKNLNSNFKSDILFFLSPSVIQFESDKKKKKTHPKKTKFVSYRQSWGGFTENVAEERKGFKVWVLRGN